MTTIELVGMFLAATAAGALGGALGMAGGVFIVPILTTIANIPWPTAVAVSLISVVACSCASAPQFLTARLPNLRLSIVLGVATAAGAIVGTFLLGTTPEQILYGIFTIVLLVSAVQMIRGRHPAPATDTDTGLAARMRVHGTYPNNGQLTPYLVQQLPLGLGAMFGAGMLSALLGIGSGVLKIPAMDAALRLPIKVSSATASLMIGVTAAGTAAAALIHGRVDHTLAAPIVIGSIIGSTIGARLLIHLAGTTLRILFIIVLLALAVPMTANTIGIGQ